MKILVIDRDAQFAALMAFALEQASYEICVAADKATALRHLLLESPDLALLDTSDDPTASRSVASCGRAPSCRSSC